MVPKKERKKERKKKRKKEKLPSPFLLDVLDSNQRLLSLSHSSSSTAATNATATQAKGFVLFAVRVYCVVTV